MCVLHLTRKHSRSMHTAYLPTISCGIPCLEGGGTPPTYPCTLDIPSPLKGTWYQRYPPPGKDMELEIPTPPVNRQTPVKTLPSRNFVCGRYKLYTCNIFCRHCCSRSLCIVLWTVCYTYEHTSLSYTIYTSPGLLPCLLQ